MGSYNYSFENNLLYLDQCWALLVLIPNGTEEKLCPIYLLNVDYKIIAKVLAKNYNK